MQQRCSLHECLLMHRYIITAAVCIIKLFMTYCAMIFVSDWRITSQDKLN